VIGRHVDAQDRAGERRAEEAVPRFPRKEKIVLSGRWPEVALQAFSLCAANASTL
jgi:hypothetical protein